MTNKSIRDYINLIENAQREEVEEGWTKLPSGDYQNTHTGVRSSKPPQKKKRGEKTGAEWDAIAKAKQDKQQGVAEGSGEDDPYKGTTPLSGKVAARNGNRLGKTYKNPHSPKYHKDRHAAWDKEYNHELSRLKSKGVAEGFDDFVKGVKRVVKGKEHPDVVAAKHLGRALGHYHQGSLPDAEKETKRYNKVQSMNKGIKTLPHPMKEQGVAEEQVEESTPDALAKIDELTRDR